MFGDFVSAARVIKNPDFRNLSFEHLIAGETAALTVLFLT